MVQNVRHVYQGDFTATDHLIIVAMTIEVLKEVRKLNTFNLGH